MTIPNLDKDPSGETYLLQTALKDLGYYTGNVDNWSGPKTEMALARFQDDIHAGGGISGLASTFADPKDVAGFKACKRQGKSDQECFKYGDNGIGCWGEDTTNPNEALAAVPPDDMIDHWGSINGAKNKKISVTANGKTFIARVADRMPYKKNIKNGAVIDLNPGAQKILGLKPPFMIPATWWWLEEETQPLVNETT